MKTRTSLGKVRLLRHWRIRRDKAGSLITFSVLYFGKVVKGTPFEICGEGGIRTHEELALLAVFKTAALGRYATSPRPIFYQFLSLD